MLRVHLRADDGDVLTMLLPGGADRRINMNGPEPWLFRGTWNHKVRVGEVFADAPNTLGLVWHPPVDNPVADNLETQLEVILDAPLFVGQRLAMVGERRRFSFTVLAVDPC